MGVFIGRLMPTQTSCFTISILHDLCRNYVSERCFSEFGYCQNKNNRSKEVADILHTRSNFHVSIPLESLGTQGIPIQRWELPPIHGFFTTESLLFSVLLYPSTKSLDFNWEEPYKYLPSRALNPLFSSLFEYIICLRTLTQTNVFS